MSVSVSMVAGPVTEAAVSKAAIGAGACLTFLGIVRPTEFDRRITGLRYDAYQPMAERMLRQVCEAARERFALLSVELAHSCGFVPVGGISLRIMVSSEHRAAAMEAIMSLIDCLKRDVPIWKTPNFASELEGMIEPVPLDIVSAADAPTPATVVAVNISLGGIPKLPVAESQLSLEGIEGDLHEHEKHRRRDRAISIQDLELLEEIRSEGYSVGPGLMGENLTVQNLHVQGLSVGDRLQFELGAVLELTSVRKPCFVLDQIDPTLKEAVVGRLGFMAKVIATGVVRPGQKITVKRRVANT